MEGGAWKAAVHGVTEGWTRLSNFSFTFHFHALEKAMATHSSVLAWRIPGTGKPGGLPSMGSHKSRTRLKRLSSKGEKRVLGENHGVGEWIIWGWKVKITSLTEIPKLTPEG